MRLLLLALLCLLAPVPLLYAQSHSDLAHEKAALKHSHAADRKAHFKADVDRLLEDSADEMISVRDGAIMRISKADRRRGMAEYFRGARYSEWDNLEDPIIRVSDDGSMAWMITRLKVARTQKDSTGVEREQKFVYAGIMMYEKVDGRWVKVANVSTFEPSK